MASSSRLTGLPALRKQNLLIEFAGLKQSCPEGVFVSLTPGDPALWSGVVFVRDGPYAPAVLRFQISFPDAYPRLPPLVTFSTDMFHPLVTPLTTYMYSTDVQDNGTVSATDEERLPPGGFSLRHGFPDWFGRQSRSRADSRQQQQQQQQQQVQMTPPRQQQQPPKSGGTPGSSKASAVGESPGFADTRKADISTYDVLRYMRSTFDDEAGEGAEEPEIAPPVPPKDDAPTAGAPGQPAGAGVRKPGEWNWEGVWEARVKKAVDASVSEAVLYGGTGAGDDVIRFLSMEEADVEAVKDNLLRTLEQAASS
ncbi:uncharacterized protein PG998_003145 [Apiospora kogelbergensis]|uniref:uncharacterized protein n=1 Tax=Apiospora kogelbergensis TaxID=1337665 RepID=UPI00312CC3D5